MKTAITKSEYFQIIGLVTLAARLEAQLKEVHKATAAVLGVTEADDQFHGHVSDMVYGQREADEAIRLLGVEVEV